MNEVNDIQALRKHKNFIIKCIAVLIISATVFALSLSGIVNIVSSPQDKTPQKEQSSSEDKPQSGSDEKEEEKIKKVASATVVNTGDILIHNPVLAGAKKSDGSYDFSKLFKQAAPYFKKADLAVANLEVSLGGTQSGSYVGYPAFNTPDELIDDLKVAGVNMLLTANNHCYDTGIFGLQRTVQVLKEKGVPYTGTRESDTEPKFIVKDVNGIKIGMACYTYATSPSSGRLAINGATIKTEANALINTFCYDKLDAFYTEAQQVMTDMKAQGAECTVFYMHWGNEYKLYPNEYQKTMAQKLCDMGVDVIVGGHPHVIQPIDLLYAQGSEHTTVCLYSMGNAVSNQRREELTGLCTTGHTEDGLLFSYTFDKYSDGSVVLSGVDVIPLWVNKVGSRYNADYTMYPLEKADDGAQKYGLSGNAAALSKESYGRTKDILAQGLTKCQQALGCTVRFAEN